MIKYDREKYGYGMYEKWRLHCITDNNNKCTTCHKSLKNIYEPAHQKCFDIFLKNWDEVADENRFV